MSSWATQHIKDLQQGKTVQFRPYGKSMEGKINSGQLCIIEPIKDFNTLKIGDIVLCKVSNNQYLHLIKDIKNSVYLIGNNKGYINGWTEASNIFGVCTKVEN